MDLKKKNNKFNVNIRIFVCRYFLYDILIFYFIKDKIVLVCDYFIVKVIIFYINSILIL